MNRTPLDFNNLDQDAQDAIAERRQYYNSLDKKVRAKLEAAGKRVEKKLELRQQANAAYLAKHFDCHVNQVYALKLDGEVFYVGLSRDPNARFLQHKRGIADGYDLKQAYVFARERVMAGAELTMEVIDPDGEKSEADWMEFFRDSGVELSNEAEGNTKKKRYTRKA